MGKMHRLGKAIVAWQRPRKDVPSWFLERKLTPQSSFAFFFSERKSAASKHWAELVQKQNGHCWCWLSPQLQWRGKTRTNFCACFPKNPVSLLSRAQPVNEFWRAKGLILHKWCSRFSGLFTYWNREGMGCVSGRQTSVTHLLFRGSEQGQSLEIRRCIVWKEPG